MTPRISRRKGLAAIAGAAAFSLTVAGCAGSSDPGTDPDTGAPTDEEVSLTILVDNTDNSINTTQALIDAYVADNPNVSIEIETRPGGAEGDNIVKTRLSTGAMNDMFWYNSGSLFQALNPDGTLLTSPTGTSRQHLRKLLAGCQHRQRRLRRSGGHRDGWRHPVQRRDLRRARA